ncbi:MAG: mechanosensitive ion channel domain-containing protein, partial [Planctomycetota bacterium]
VVVLLWRFRHTPKPVATASAPAVETATELSTEATTEPVAEPTTVARLRALVAAVLRAAVVPVALGLAVLLVYRLDLAPALEAPLVTVLTVLAWVVLVRGVAKRLLAANGVATRFLGASEDVTAQLLRNIRFITTAALLLYLPWSLLRAAPFQLVGLPRLLELAWFLCLGLVMIRVIRYRGPVVQRLTRPDGVARQVWRLIGLLFVACLVVVLFLHLGGYRNGASHLMMNLVRTFVSLFALAAAYKLFTAAAGRAIDAVASRRGRAEGANAEQLEASAHAARRLTHNAAILGVVIAAFLLGRLWGFGKPLMGFLGEIELLDPDKNGDWLTALDVFTALLWVIAGHFIARNLGRIYDAVATRRGITDHGGRFALITLVRYAVIVIAYTLALLAIDIDLTTLGWMATAASVGLGFGLQEIVANFISGLILLFERPVRVGDIIAVGDTAGIVDRITIRSTYVTNWERQTFIVPNKNFITQNVINWTRNDQVMRRVLKVGTAYGSDVDKVVKILDEVCKENPRVLDEPQHRIWFMGFGEYRLEFEIWVFTNITLGFATMTALYTQIYKRLQEAGIVIPVPRRDVHVHGEGRLPTAESMPGADAPRLAE